MVNWLNGFRLLCPLTDWPDLPALTGLTEVFEAHSFGIYFGQTPFFLNLFYYSM